MHGTEYTTEVEKLYLGDATAYSCLLCFHSDSSTQSTTYSRRAIIHSISNFALYRLLALPRYVVTHIGAS